MDDEQPAPRKKKRKPKVDAAPPAYVVAPPPPPTRSISGRAIGAFVAALIAILVLTAWGGSVALDAKSRELPFVKLAIVLAAAGWSALFGLLGAAAGLPKILRYVRNGGLTVLAVAALGAFMFTPGGYEHFYHRHAMFQRYLGSKYFPELGYDGLYTCAAVSESERQPLTRGASKRTPYVRDLTTFELVPAPDLAARDGGACQRRLGARWAAFARDVAFLESQSEPDYWEGMKKDRGYNGAPGFTLLAGRLASLTEASVSTFQWLAYLDPLLLLATFGAITWAFGLHAASASLIGGCCLGFAPSFWTRGSYLEFLGAFLAVLSMCLVRKSRPLAAGALAILAALVDATAIWPGVAWLGLLLVRAIDAKRRGGDVLSVESRRALIGALSAAAVVAAACFALLGASVTTYYTRAAYHALTNDMGLRVVLGHPFYGGPGSARMRYNFPSAGADVARRWKEMRAERFESTAWALWLLRAALTAFWAVWMRRVRRPWIAMASSPLLATVWSTFANYRGTFVATAAALVKLVPWIDVPLYLFAAVTQVIACSATYNDDLYAAESLALLVVCVLVIVLALPIQQRRARAALPGPRTAYR